MRRLIPLLLPLVALSGPMLVAPTVAAQVPAADSARTVSPSSAIPRPANDSIFRRARRLVSEGNGTAGRALVDSILRVSDPTTPAYGEALYWHGALAPTAAEAERDYRRVIVEYPLSYYADDALLSIAELEQARGDRAGALQHLQRFVREHPASAARGIAALGAARLAFEQRDQQTGCAMLAEARGAATSRDVELRNQIEYYSTRCSDTTAAATTRTATTAPATNTPTVPNAPTRTPTSAPPRIPPRTTTPPAPAGLPVKSTPRVASAPSATSAPRAPSGAPRTAYTIQVAAYNTHADAEQLVRKLASRGITARVSGTSQPFRVRLGFYDTRQAAAAEVAALKKRGIVGFVAEEARPMETRTR